jgi:hypothetical protein
MPEELYLDLLKKCLTASIYDESGWQVLKRLTINERPVVAVQPSPLDAARRQTGRDWPLFGYSMIGHRRFDNVRYCIEHVLEHRVEGDLIETGVWRGGTTIWMRSILKVYGVTDRAVWVADSFEGMPPKGPRDQDSVDPDLSRVAYLNVPLDEVRRNFERFGLLDEQVRFLKGWFHESLPAAPIEQLAVLRIDCDLYESTHDVLTSLYRRVSPGGFVIVDDYLDWQGCRRAVDEFRAASGISAPLVPIDCNGVFWQVPGS